MIFSWMESIHRVRILPIMVALRKHIEPTLGGWNEMVSNKRYRGSTTIRSNCFGFPWPKPGVASHVTNSTSSWSPPTSIRPTNFASSGRSVICVTLQTISIVRSVQEWIRRKNAKSGDCINQKDLLMEENGEVNICPLFRCRNYFILL